MIETKNKSVVEQQDELMPSEAEDPFCGDVSSIMVKADMIDNFNIAE